MQRTRPGHGTTLRRGFLGAMTLASVTLLAACTATPGGGATPGPTAVASPAGSTAASAAPSSAPTTAASATVNVSADGFVTDKDGKSLYLFTNDSGGTSACTGNCAGSWPPLAVASATAATAGTGVTGALATITRDDGSLQVTLAGHPLYYFAGDAAAGDKNGQGLNDVWYLVDGAGTAIDSDDGPEPSPSKCGGPACY